MNGLSIAGGARIVRCPCEGNSVRSTRRITGFAKSAAVELFSGTRRGPPALPRCAGARLGVPARAVRWNLGLCRGEEGEHHGGSAARRPGLCLGVGCTGRRIEALRLPPCRRARCRLGSGLRAGRGPPPRLPRAPNRGRPQALPGSGRRQFGANVDPPAPRKIYGAASEAEARG